MTWVHVLEQNIPTSEQFLKDKERRKGHKLTDKRDLPGAYYLFNKANTNRSSIIFLGKGKGSFSGRDSAVSHGDNDCPSHTFTAFITWLVTTHLAG